MHLLFGSVCAGHGLESGRALNAGGGAGTAGGAGGAGTAGVGGLRLVLWMFVPGCPCMEGASRG